MGFVWLGLLALLTLALLWLLKLRGPLMTLAAAAIAFSCAGYALQGHPDLGGSPRASSTHRPPLPLTGARHALMGQFDAADAWLSMSEALASRGNTEDAANLLRAQVNRHPGDYRLWVGLGNALTDHSRTLTPSARFAYERAMELAPTYPAPPFFLGLAEARSGNPDEAIRLWSQILANAPANASWRPMIEDGLLLMTSPQPERAQGRGN